PLSLPSFPRRRSSDLDIAVDEGVVRKSGAWYTYDDEQLGQGRENAKRFLRENPELAMQLQARVYEAVGFTTADEGEAAELEEEVDRKSTRLNSSHVQI